MDKIKMDIVQVNRMISRCTELIQHERPDTEIGQHTRQLLHLLRERREAWEERLRALV